MPDHNPWLGNKGKAPKLVQNWQPHKNRFQLPARPPSGEVGHHFPTIRILKTLSNVQIRPIFKMSPIDGVDLIFNLKKMNEMLQVTEGGSMTLTSRHVQLALDYEKFGVRESGVLLHLVRPPQYGRLFSTLWRRADEATFTLLDVHSDRVRPILNLIPFFKF